MNKKDIDLEIRRIANEFGLNIINGKTYIQIGKYSSVINHFVEKELLKQEQEHKERLKQAIRNERLKIKENYLTLINQYIYEEENHQIRRTEDRLRIMRGVIYQLKNLLKLS